MKEITIGGKSYPVAFNMQTLLNFEEITNKSFFACSFEKTSERMAVILAACLSANEKSTLTVDALRGNGDFEAFKEIITAFNTIMELSKDFFKIPEVVAESEKEETSQETEENAKN